MITRRHHLVLLGLLIPWLVYANRICEPSKRDIELIEMNQTNFIINIIQIANNAGRLAGRCDYLQHYQGTPQEEQAIETLRDVCKERDFMALYGELDHDKYPWLMHHYAHHYRLAYCDARISYEGSAAAGNCLGSILTY